MTVGKKSLREHFEAISHREAISHHEAIRFVEGLVSKSEAVSEWNIRSIHQLVMKNIGDTIAGRYRAGNVIISGAGFIPPFCNYN